MKTARFAALLAVLLVAMTAFAPSTQAAAAKSMRIGIIGAGNIGGTLAKQWVEAGHEVMLSSRHPDALRPAAEALGPRARVGTPREAAAFGEVLFFAVPYAALPDLGKDLASEIKGKVALDACNPIERRDGAMAKAALAQGSGVATQALLPGTKVVRAFNAIGFRSIASEAHRAGELAAIPIAGDDAKAVEVASQLVRDAGFDPVLVGGLASSKRFDMGSGLTTQNITARELRAKLAAQ